MPECFDLAASKRRAPRFRPKMNCLLQRRRDRKDPGPLGEQMNTIDTPVFRPLGCDFPFIPAQIEWGPGRSVGGFDLN
jgi:hypothetical protein